MSDLTDLMEDRIINWFRGTTFPAAPSNIYIALFTAAPTDAGGGTEVTGGAYARQQFVLANPSGGKPVGNTAQVVFPEATANWGNVTHAAIMDAGTGGNMLAWSALDAPKTVNTGQRAVYDPNTLHLDIQ